MRVRDCFKEGLLRKTKPSNQYAIKSLEASLSYIEDAKDNLKMNNNNLVIFCSYTAMFHAARSLLFRDGVTSSQRLKPWASSFNHHSFKRVLSLLKSYIDVQRRKFGCAPPY